MQSPADNQANVIIQPLTRFCYTHLQPIIASIFSFGGRFLGCFNSSTALGVPYIVNPKDLFTSAIYAVCTLNPYYE